MNKLTIFKKVAYNCNEDNEGDGAYNLNPSMTLKDNIWNVHLSKREIIINQEIDESIIEKAVLQIWNINNQDATQDANRAAIGAEPGDREPICILLNTSGGAIDEAFSLISAIESSTTPVITIALGKAWSAGFLILLAGHHRVVQKHTSLMYHQGSAGYIGPFGQHIEYTEYFRKIQDRVEQYVKEKTKISQKKLEDIFNRKQDWFIYPEEALQYGVIDDIIGRVEEPAIKEEKPKKPRKPIIKKLEEPKKPVVKTKEKTKKELQANVI